MDLIYFLWLKKRTADQEVPGSNSFATFGYGAFWKNQCLDFKSRQIKRLTGSNPGAPFGLGRFEIFKLLTSIKAPYSSAVESLATDEEAPVQIWVPPLDLVKFWNNQSPDFKVKLLFF